MTSGREAQQIGPEKIGAIIERILRQTGIRNHGDQDEVVRAWRDVAGSEIDERTRVVSFHRGVLTVAVDSAPLFQELETFERPRLLREVRERLTGTHVEQLRFRLE